MSTDNDTCRVCGEMLSLRAEMKVGLHIGCYFDNIPKNVKVREIGYGFRNKAQKNASQAGKDTHKGPPKPW